MFLQIYAICVSVAVVALAILHFWNPYPLIQIPDRGHRLFAVPKDLHMDIVQLLKIAGCKPFGTFTAGVRQTLFRDGFTVIASGEAIQSAAISLPVNDPQHQALFAAEFLRRRGVAAVLWQPPEENLRGRLFVLKLPFGWDLAYRLAGSNMPLPKWE